MTESLLCNSCGAPLEVPESANFAKCQHCHTSLRIHRAGGATTTEVMEKLAETTSQLADQVERLTKQNELKILERDWEAERSSLLVRGKHGSRHVPGKGVAWGIGAMTVFFGGIWTVMAIAITSSGPDWGPFRVAKFVFPLFGIGFMLAGIFGSTMVYHRAKQYEAAEREYQRRRDSILRGEKE